MDRNCRNCKYCNNGICSNFSGAEVKGKDAIIDFIEEGVLSEVIEEALSIEKLAKAIESKLRAEGYLKKVVKSNDVRAVLEDLKFELIENIDYAVHIGLMNHADSYKVSNKLFKINDIEEFYCNNWE